MASSEIDATIGTVRIPTPIPAASSEKIPMSSKMRWSTSGATNEIANRPSTTDGTLASVSISGFTRPRTRGEAYSDR